MNKLAIALSTLLTLGAISTANAQSGTITFNGEVTAVTCNVSFNGVTGTSPTVTMPTVPTSALAAGSTAGKTPVTVHVGGTDAQCTTGTVALELNHDRDALLTNGRLRNLAVTNAAANVLVNLRDSKDALIDLTMPWSSERVNLGAGGADILFASEYFANGAAAGAGAVTANVKYTLDYN